MLPHVSWPDLVPPDTQIAPRETHHVNGNVSEFELEVITRLVKYHQPVNLFEIGTFDGRTTLNMAAHAAPDARVFTLDLPPIGEKVASLQLEVGDRLFINKQQSGGRFAGSDLAHKITQLYGDSGNFDFSPWYEKMDFIFVDGSHSYEYVLSDSQVAMMMAMPDAVILWHDYVSEGPTPWPGVRRALHEMQETDERFHELRQISGTSIVYLQVPGPKARYIAPPQQLWQDSSQPEYLTACLSVSLGRTRIAEGSPLEVFVRVTNTGRAAWLPEGAALGPVRLGSRLLDTKGTWISDNFSRSLLPVSSPVQPGETVSFMAKIQAPPRGDYVIDFDMVAEGVAWFSRNGSQTVKIPVSVV